jgi:mannosyltransferase
MMGLAFMKRFFTNLAAFAKSHPRLDFLTLLIGLVVFALIALGNVSNASIWFDEAFSAYITQFNFIDIARYTATDVHPPVYYWLLKSWELLFGASVEAIRGFSILFGAAAIGAGFFLVRRLFGRAAASLSLLFMVVSPMLVRYSDEARMYTLVATIALLATHVLVSAVASRRRWQWVLYGVLVALGMLTHYFVLLVWIAHWVWRAAVVRRSVKSLREFARAFFSKNWIIAHVVAIAVFLPWLPFMAIQVGVVQIGGFWIGPVTLGSLANYLTNVMFYLEQNYAQGWFMMLAFLALVALIILGVRGYRRLARRNKDSFLLIASLAVVPVLTLIVLSLPPLRPTFVERYLVVAALAFALLAAVIITMAFRSGRRFVPIALSVIIIGSGVFGITNVYAFGNYNRNSNTHILTRELIAAVKEKAEPGEPIIASSPWVFYEAITYSTPENPVYFIDETTEYLYGSLDMLKYNDQHKIKDLDAFTRQHPEFWYIGTAATPLEPVRTNWQRLQDVSVTSPIDGKTFYRAAEFSQE